MSEVSAPFHSGPKGVSVAVVVTPKAAVNRVGAAVPTAHGMALRVRVTAAPEKGRANKAVIRLLAKEWGLAARDLTLSSGATSRHKVVRVAGDVARTVLENWWAERQ